MQRLTKLPIAHKLTAITMLTTVTVMLLMAVAVVLNEVIEQKGSIYQKRIEQLTTVAEIIGSRSTAALIFDDPQTATENLAALNALRTEAKPLLAAILTPDNKVFSRYQTSPHLSQAHSYIFVYGCETQQSQLVENSWLAVCSPIILDNERVGEVHILFDMASDLAQLQTIIFRYLILVAGFVLLAFVLAWFISSRLQRLISTPILNLRAAMQAVSEQGDYSIRAERMSDDELGALVNGFNHMLTQIQSRDAELAHYSNQLESEVAARSAELAEANRRRMLWLENVARFLRHELKNTLIGLRSSLDLIERRAIKGDIEKYVARAKTSVGYINNLLENVGNASTLEASFHKETRQRIDLSTLIAQQIDCYRTIYRESLLQVDCKTQVEVQGNEPGLIQLLDKLISNAVDHSLPNTPICVSLRRRGGQALLTVANQGQPLPQDKKRIFELFVSLRDRQRKHSDNLGLGLYIVKLVAESHGGCVWAEDMPDRNGAVFKVTLPLA
jgi:signal transduction histidine kinase